MKNPFIRSKISMQDRITSKATSIANKLVSRKLKNKNLDQRAVVMAKLIPQVGTPMVRTAVIDSIESEVAELVKAGKTDKEILQPCKDSPNYMKLLDEIGLNLEHIKVVIKEHRAIVKDDLKRTIKY